MSTQASRAALEAQAARPDRFPRRSEFTNREDYDAAFDSANIAALRAQAIEPVATLHDDGHWTWNKKHPEPYESRFAGWRMEVYASPKPPRRARKVGGSYQADGHVVCTFTTRSGAVRHVFEFDQPAGMLHIFNSEQIEFSTAQEGAK